MSPGKRRTPQRFRSPTNLMKAKSASDPSDFLIIRLKAEVVLDDARSLDQVAEKFSLRGVATLLNEYKLSSRPLITSVSVEQLRQLEQRARDKTRGRGFAPRHSLASYWRLDARGKSLKDVLAKFHDLKGEVDLGYLERMASAPARAAANPFEPEQHYLDPAPTGINARWAWAQGFDGTGMSFIDLEEGWFLEHEDLPKRLQVIFNDNRDNVILRDHGTAVLGEIAGKNNDRGIIGIAPEASVSVISHFHAASDTNGHVADAICAAIWPQPPHVLLLEVQKGELPTEIDEGDFDAIQYAVANGVIVIEAAGNGGFDLDRWVDDNGLNRMNRASADFWDSGAILVGAASSATPHERLSESNFGSRLDCYAWG